MTTEELHFDLRDGLAVVTLQRPTRSNALSRSLLAALGEVGAVLAREPSLRAVILTGSGDKAFCAGADLKERREMSPDAIREQLRAYRAQLAWLTELPVPTVAAINGVALGGGLELAMMCDLRVAAAHARFGLPETSLGIIPGAGGTQRLPRLIGTARALEVVLLGRRLDAQEALSWGLLHRVVPEGEPLLEATIAWLRPILEGAPIAQRAALRALREALSLPLDEGLARELLHYETCLQSEDRLEALRALQERRAPRFVGR